MPDTEKKLFLLDAMALIYRAYFALNKNPRINSKGLNTSAVLGFANTLLELLKNERPSHMGVVFDSFAPTLRHESYQEYKANREDMPEDIVTSLPYIRSLIEGFNIPILAKDGYEADDIIGTLAKRAEKEGYKTFMVTPDKDFGQLVSENILMYKPARAGEGAQILGVKEICEKFSIERPEQVIDILGLWGDSSDNIPGIPGIGEKRSKELIGKYGSVESLIEHAGELKGKLKENVIAFADQGRQSKELATIIIDAPVEFDPEELRISPPNEDKLAELFDELEFRNYSRRVAQYLRGTDSSSAPKKENAEAADLFSSAGVENPSSRQTIADVSHEYHLIENEKQLKDLLKLLSKSKAFCFDTETTDLDTLNAELVGIAFSVKENEAFYVPFPEKRDDCIDKLQLFKDIFEDKDSSKIGQNLKYDLSVLKTYGIDVFGPLRDTMIAHYLLEPDLRHNMDFLAEEYLDYTPVSIESLIGKKGAKQGNMRDLKPEQVKDYACEDADVTLKLWNIFGPKLKETATADVFENIEMPLIKVLAAMEVEGVALDTDALSNISRGLAEEIIKVKKDIFELSGTQFNVGSPKQLGEVLFEKLKVTDKPKRTRTKQYSTGEDVLRKLSDKHPIIDKVLEHRSLTKLKSTYVDALPSLISKKTGRVHTSYNQAVAATGRLSSSNPNLQNIPIRSERGREIRKAFIPRNEEFTLLAADYSQIELRLIAHLSEDPAMQDAFKNNEDIHTSTAAKVFGVSPGEVDRAMRSKAKEVNFGLAYGMSAFGLAENLGIPRKEASEIIEQYFKQYPGIKDYMEKQVDFARSHGYVETIMKRRRYLRDIRSSNGVVRGLAERNAINAPIQGSSADMIKIAMIRIQQEIEKQNLLSRMVMQVHDELVFDAANDELDGLRKLVEMHMKQAIGLSVPVVVDMNTGNNWLEAH